MHPQTQTAAPETVWYWFGQCRKSKEIRIEVLLNGRQLYRSSFPICRMSRANVTAEQAQRRLVFFFKGGHLFRDEYRTTPVQTIEGNIWEAGGDPNDLLLGVSFATKRQMLLNTIHIIKPCSLSVSKFRPRTGRQSVSGIWFADYRTPILDGGDVQIGRGKPIFRHGRPSQCSWPALRYTSTRSVVHVATPLPKRS